MNCSRNGRSKTHVHKFGRELSWEEIVRTSEKEMFELIDGFFTLWIRYGPV